MEQNQACLPVQNTSHAFIMMSLQLGLTVELQDAYSNQQPQELLAPLFLFLMLFERPSSNLMMGEVVTDGITQEGGVHHLCCGCALCQCS